MNKLSISPVSVCVARVLAMLLILTGSAAATAQVGDIADHQWSFHNTSDSEITVEVVSVSLRNGREVPVNTARVVKPNQHIWLENNNQKITGTSLTLIIRSPGRATATNFYRLANGDYRIEFPNGWLKSHLESPVREQQNFIPPIDPATERHRNFLLHQVNRVRSAMKGDDEASIFATKALMKTNRDYADLLEESARREATKGNTGQAVTLRLAAEAPRALAQKIQQEIDAAETRNRIHRALIQGYERELQALTATQAPTLPPAGKPMVR